MSNKTNNLIADLPEKLGLENCRKAVFTKEN